MHEATHPLTGRRHKLRHAWIVSNLLIPASRIYPVSSSYLVLPQDGRVPVGAVIGYTPLCGSRDTAPHIGSGHRSARASRRTRCVLNWPSWLPSSFWWDLLTFPSRLLPPPSDGVSARPRRPTASTLSISRMRPKEPPRRHRPVRPLLAILVCPSNPVRAPTLERK